MKKLILLVTLCCLVCFPSCNKKAQFIEYKNSAVTAYPVAKGAEQSSHYKCTVSGQQVQLYSMGEDAYGILKFNSTAKVTIDSDHVVSNATVYSQSATKKVSLENSVIEFTVSRPGSYVVNLDDKNKIYLIFDEENYFGAIDTNTEVFEQGVNKTKAKIEKGVLNLKSDTTYFLQYGSVLSGKIVGDNVSNVTIIGGGVVTDGIALTDCDNIDVNLVTVTGSVDVSHSSNIKFENTKIISETNALTFISCADSEFTGGFIKSHGDSVSVKNAPHLSPDLATDDVDIEFDKSENITISNCVVDSVDGNSLQIGRETVGDRISDITFKNITIVENINGVALAVNNFNNSKISRVVFDNITVENAQPKSDSNFLIDIKNMYSLEYSDLYASTPIGDIDGITFRNINMTSGKKDIGISFRGYKEAREQYQSLVHKVSNIYFKDCEILGVKLSRSYYYMYLGSHVEGLIFE